MSKKEYEITLTSKGLDKQDLSKIAPVIIKFDKANECRLRQVGILSNVSLINLTCFIEGFKNIVYKDSLGYATCGFGHLLSVEEKQRWPVGTVIEDRVLVTLFLQDLSSHIYRAKQNINLDKYSANNIRNILIYLYFNMGNKFQSFKNTLKAAEFAGSSDVTNVNFLLELADSVWATQCPRALRVITNYLLFGNITETYIDVASAPTTVINALRSNWNKAGRSNLMKAAFTDPRSVSLYTYLSSL